MFLHELTLISLTVAVLIGVPIYIAFRNPMVSKTGNLNFTKRRVIRLTAVNIIINSLVFVMFFLMGVSILQTPYLYTSFHIVLTLFFVLFLGITFYGNGIYLTSVVLEAYTAPQLRQFKHFKTQFIATHLFHGPISHILIYSGYILALMTLSLIEISIGGATTQGIQYLLLCSGLVMGIVFAFAQLYNGSAPYQLITSLLSVLLFSFVLVSFNVKLMNTSVPLYFLAFAVSFQIVMLIYFILVGFKGQNINWDKSGY